MPLLIKSSVSQTGPTLSFSLSLSFTLWRELESPVLLRVFFLSYISFFLFLFSFYLIFFFHLFVCLFVRSFVSFLARTSSLRESSSFSFSSPSIPPPFSAPPLFFAVLSSEIHTNLLRPCSPFFFFFFSLVGSSFFRENANKFYGLRREDAHRRPPLFFFFFFLSF